MSNWGSRVFGAARGRGPTLVALAVGAAPGFLLPMVVTTRLALEDASAMLLVMNFGQIAFSSLAAPYETTMLVRFGTVYGSTGPLARPQFGRLMLRALSRQGPLLVGAMLVLTVATSLITDEFKLGYLQLLAAPVVGGVLVQLMATPLTAHLYATRHLAPVYFSTIFRGGPALVAALLTSNVFVVTVVFASGELLRWLALAWWVQRSLVGIGNATDVALSPPTWRELAPQVGASIAGQGIPLVQQGLLAALGPQAVAVGSIALRVWGAAFQVGVATIAMPEVVEFARGFQSVTQASRPAWIAGRARRLLVVSLLAAGVGASVVFGCLLLPSGVIPPITASGLMWSLVLIVGFPPAMVHFWAGRGLITIGANTWVMWVVLIGLGVGSAVAGAALPFLGGVAAMMASAASFASMALGSYIVLRRRARD